MYEIKVDIFEVYVLPDKKCWDKYTVYKYY